MTFRKLALCALFALPASLAQAEAPKQLYNKTIALSWHEVRVQKADAGDTARMSTSSTVLVYISDQGRMFTRISRSNERGSNKTDKSPDGDEQKSGQGASNLNPDFTGQTLSIISPMRSGARNVVATFSAGFQGCTLRVAFGKESGQALYHKGMDGRMYTIVSTNVSGASCSIRSGNAFGGG